MSKTKTDGESPIEETFASKLGIEMTTPRVFEELIEAHAGTRVVVTAVGPSGIGKTAIPKQIAARRNGGKGVPYIPLHVPTMTLEDCHIPTMASDTKLYYDRRISRRFQPMVEWIEKVKKGLKKDEPFPMDMVPILAVEELNRGVDKAVTRAIFVMIDDRMVGDLQIPDEVQIVVTMNPTGGGMAVNEFERDPAMRRRLLPVGVTFNYGDFMKHATTAKFHPDIIAHLGAQPNGVYDEQSALAGKAFACPATWETVSRICWRFQELKLSLMSTAGRAAIAGAIGTGAATMFLEFVKDHTLSLTPDDVLTNYGSDGEMRRRFKSFLTEGGGRLDKITDLATGVAIKLFIDLKKKHDPFIKPLSHFMNDLPVEILMSFIAKVTEESNRLGTDGKNYMNGVNIALVKEPAFTEALKRLHDAKMAVDKETAGKT